jgi:2-methylcitrate dehydratase PrpD
MGTTEKIAKFVFETNYDALPTETIEIAKKAIIDSVGITLAGYKEKGGSIVTKIIRELGGASQTRIVVDGVKAPVTDVAFAHGAMAEFLDYGDSYNAPTTHPSCTVVPVVLALGEKLRSSGRDVIEAYVLGMEIGGKVGFGAVPNATSGIVWSPIKYLGCLQATIAAAKMLKLDMDQIRVALAIVSTTVGGPMATFWSMIKGIHSGDTARSGIMAALLAKGGFTGEKNIIEIKGGFADSVFGEGNYDLDKMTSNLGNPYHIIKPGLDFKKYPCCFGTQWSLDALIPILEKHKISYEDIENVELISPLSHKFLNRPNPETEIEAKFSLQYVIGATILDGRPVIDTFHEPRIFDARQREAMKRIKITHSKAALIRSPEWENNVTVRMKNGQEYKNSVDFPTPLSFDDIVAKYEQCAQIVLPPKQVKRSIELLKNLDTVKDVTVLMDALIASKS